jgi:hypothetical protein
MLTRPSHLSPAQIDTTDTDFHAHCVDWAKDMRSEIDELVILSRKSLNESWALLAQINRVLERR